MRIHAQEPQISFLFDQANPEKVSGTNGTVGRTMLRQAGVVGLASARQTAAANSAGRLMVMSIDAAAALSATDAVVVVDADGNWVGASSKIRGGEASPGAMSTKVFRRGDECRPAVKHATPEDRCEHGARLEMRRTAIATEVKSVQRLATTRKALRTWRQIAK
ncbi:MAG: hypothetical protein KDA44_16015 [Planctomycetales bacterium]|nr:hypothetical protein [Planctomycetales bacterium]